MQVYIDGPRGQACVVDDPTDLPALNERLMDLHRAESTHVLAREIGDETRTLVGQVLDDGAATPDGRSTAARPSLRTARLASSSVSS